MAGMKVRITVNPSVADELGETREVQSFLKDASFELRPATRGRLPGPGASPFTAVWMNRGNGRTGRKRGRIVGSRWPIAHIIEWGSVNNPAYAPLRRAVRSLGWKFEEI